MSPIRIAVDAGEVGGWARRMAGARGAVREELTGMTRELVALGVETARELVRVETGRLRDSIVAETEAVGDAVTGSWAPGTEYAVIHEFGGVIRPRRGRYLRFTGRGGRPVFVRKVAITARPYMRPSAAAVRGRMGAALTAAARGLVGRLAR